RQEARPRVQIELGGIKSLLGKEADRSAVHEYFIMLAASRRIGAAVYALRQDGQPGMSRARYVERPLDDVRATDVIACAIQGISGRIRPDRVNILGQYVRLRRRCKNRACRETCNCRANSHY